jgi:hypothetical protein
VAVGLTFPFPTPKPEDEWSFQTAILCGEVLHTATTPAFL